MRDNCCCCFKILNRIYEETIHGNIFLFCSDCHYFYKESKRLVEKGINIPQKIVDFALTSVRHCTACIMFDKNCEKQCKHHLWTGVGDEKHSENYPYSYANHGCSYFRTSR